MAKLWKRILNNNNSNRARRRNTLGGVHTEQLNAVYDGVPHVEMPAKSSALLINCTPVKTISTRNILTKKKITFA